MASPKTTSKTTTTASGLSTPVQYVKGIGPRRASVLQQLAIHTVRDLLYYFPRDYIDLSRVERIGNLRRFMDSGQYVTIIGTVRTYDLVGRPPRQRFVVILGDESGSIPLVFFQSVNYFKKAFSVGELLAVSGKVTSFQNRPQIVHPSIDRLAEGKDEDGGLEGFVQTGGIVPKYSSSQELQGVKLDTKGFRRILRSALDEFAEQIPEFLSHSILRRHQLMPIVEAIRQIHFPESYDHLREAQRRLKFDELFFLELLLAVRRKIVKVETPGIAFKIESKLARQLVDSLPFKLTKAQIRVIREIADDMRAPKPMNRLLQGDVGSGKTVVALISMLIAVENGYQAAFMAPTEILAEQHFGTLKRLLNELPVNVRLLIGGQSKKLREDIMEDIRRGTAQIVVGTHALIQEGVEFGNLGIAVIDEQHRFGVAQRLAMREKGIDSQSRTVHPDILVMTATPIPRTLSLTLYGDLDVSVIDELPHGRRPIKTIVKFESQREWVYSFVRNEVAKGRQAYFVYPLVEESEKVDLKAAAESRQLLQEKVFPDLRVGLIHGRMSAEEKDDIMSDFKHRKIHILVSTTVIEVGIDISNATVMVVEHAERFGLAQLHQLRGRVGRRADQSYCILVTPDWMNPLVRKSGPLQIDDESEEKGKAATRIRTMLETTDGFRVAEVDLQIRGPGDFFGTRQSGFPELRIANLLEDGEILEIARREAFAVVEADPQLRHPEHRELKKHFVQFYGQSVQLLAAS